MDIPTQNTSNGVNQNLIIGILAAIVILGGGYFLLKSDSSVPGTEATSTPITAVDTTYNPTPAPNPISSASAPIVVTNSSVATTETTAVVTGTVNPNGALTSYRYEYGTTVSFGSKTASQTIGSGNVAIPAPSYITGLTKDTTYYFRIIAENQFDTVAGSQYAFHTTINTPAPVGNAPISKTLAATAISRTTADLQGGITPNKASTQYWFEYGNNGNLGNVTALASVGNGSISVPVAVSVSNLEPATNYYYRVNAQNQFGTVNGSILTFQTSGPATTAVAPVVTTQVASSIAEKTAIVRGTVNPNGAQTTYWFEYSTDSLIGSVLGKTTSQRSAGAGTNTVSVEANISGLQSGTTYNYRVMAQNSAGTVSGNSLSLRTN